MVVSARTPVGDVVAKQPRAAAVFERHRIDYWCDGSQSLAAACRRASVDTRVVLEQLARAAAESSLERDWTSASLTSLIDHILSVHHASIWKAMPALSTQLAIAERGEKAALQTVVELRGLFAQFRGEMERHLGQEEESLFPVIARYERAQGSGSAPFGGLSGVVRGWIGRLAVEHRAADEALQRIRTATGDYQPPTGGSETCRMLFADLVRLEADLHRHIHLENNILFPRATALEAAYE